MALRSLDNALPDAIQRPKKVAKFSAIPLDKASSPASVENMDPTLLPNAGDQSPEYIVSDDLKPLTDPEARIKNLREELASKNWIQVSGALNDVRRLALHHSSLLQPILEEVMQIIEKSMKNPRSALCKIAIMTSADIFHSFGHLLMSMSDHNLVFDNVLLQLLLKASQDKRFVCEEAAKVLEKMVESIPLLPLVNKLQPYVSHSNLRVRAKAGTAISKSVSNMSYVAMKDFGIPNLLQVAAELLNDRLPEAREAARSIICSIYREISQVSDTKEDNGDGAAVAVLWRDLCASILPPNRAHSVEKIVLQ